ncbi:MAG: carboxypeptidase regulatory-like domain-containing protein [Candidatus Electrothrix sp. AX2]|nr:carboxypeptidase regulatory-like domain-containing protein [Candidatus Electrothrix gigas]
MDTASDRWTYLITSILFCIAIIFCPLTVAANQNRLTAQTMPDEKLSLAAVSSEEETGAISGRVTDGTAGIPDVRIDVYNNYSWLASADTDENGNYTVIGLPAGEHKVKFSEYNSNYADEWYNDKGGLYDADPVSVTVNSTTPDIDAILEPGGSISGTVTDTSGAGIPGVIVYVFDNYPFWLGSAGTDENGNYTVIGLPAGEHNVEFSTYNSNYIKELYPDQVSVTVNATTSNIDAVLELGGSISGTVTDSSGAGIQNISIYIYNNYSPIGNPTETDENGKYTVTGLPVGEYKVLFSDYDDNYVDQWYNGHRDSFDANPISVTVDATTPNIDAVLELGNGSISGTVTDISGAGIPDVLISVYDGNNYNSELGSASTDENGNYTVIGLPAGEHKVKFSKYNYVEEWYDNKRKLFADLVTVTNGADTSDIDAVLVIGGRISGTVKNKNGEGIPDVDVHVHGGSFVRTDENGKYTVIELPAGEYAVQFSKYGSYVTEWYNNAPQIYCANPVSVVLAQTTANINIVLVEGGGISGTVTDSSGVGLANIYVSATARSKHSRFPFASGSAYTDIHGHYTINALPAGMYRIDYSDTSQNKYYREYYNDKIDFDIADQVAVVDGRITPNIDAVLDIPGGISGIVTDEDGNAVPDIQVEILGPDDHRESVHTDSTGSYTVSLLPPGDYTVKFHTDGTDFIRQQYDDVNVSIAEVTPNINAVLARGGRISGTVTDENGNGIFTAVRIYNADSNDYYSWDSVYTQSYTAAGAYTIKGLPSGSYKVWFPGLCNSFLGEWYDDQADPENAVVLSVTAPYTTSDINAVLLPDSSSCYTGSGGKISGTVRKGNAASRCTEVSIYDIDHNWIDSIWTDYKGEYLLTETYLPSGSYKVNFYNWYDDIEQWYNRKKDFDHADPVSVTAPETTVGINAFFPSNQGSLTSILMLLLM